MSVSNNEAIVMSSPDIRVNNLSTSSYARILVFFPKFEIPNGDGAYRAGVFKDVDVEKTFFASSLTNFDLEKDMQKVTTENVVKPVYATLDGSRYYVASLFCRLRVNAKQENIDKMVEELNNRLEEVEEKYRDGVADEWCAQEVFKVFPDLEDCPDADVADHDNPLCACQVNFDAKRALNALLPQGY